MRNGLLSAAVTAAVLATGAATSVAADKETVLTNLQAPVMINQGESYVEAREGMHLYQGDQLMVLNGGSAQVQYANGCVESVGANAVSRIGSAEACVTAASAGTYNQAGGPTGGSGGSSSTNLLVGVAGIAAVGAGAFYLVDDDNSGVNNNRPPVSP